MQFAERSVLISLVCGFSAHAEQLFVSHVLEKISCYPVIHDKIPQKEKVRNSVCVCVCRKCASW